MPRLVTSRSWFDSEAKGNSTKLTSGKFPYSSEKALFQIRPIVSETHEPAGMSDLDFSLFELDLGLAKLEIYQHASVQTNIHWRGQECEGGAIDLEALDPEAWKTYFRYCI